MTNITKQDQIHVSLTKFTVSHIKHKIHYTEHIKHVPNDCGNPTHPPTGHQSIKYFAFFTD